MKWSNEQLEAIKSCYTNELVNAGAGSGKTAVLSEHVIHLIKNNNFELKDFLIVTFTNDAANEMKQRIRDNLLKEESLSYMVDQIETAHIQTFDAFNLFIVKKYAHVLGLNNNLSILDQSILDVETIRIIDELFEQKYLQKDEEFASLISSLCVKNDKDVKILISNIIKVSDRAIDSEQYLDTFVTHFYSDEFIDNLISERFEEMKDTLNRALYLCDEIDDSDIGDNYKSTILSLLTNKDYDSLLLAASSVKLAKKSSKSVCENEELRKYVMDLLNSFKNKKFNFGFSNDIKNFYKKAQKYAEIVIKLTKVVLNRINEFKHKYNMYTFNDIAKFAIEAMNNDDVRYDVRNTFRYIMVDEYQDTNGIQETMIELLEDNKVFMVGDVKQSIYRFRNADCTIFENKYQKYKKNINGHAIDMTENYRSRKEFMADLNYMFSLLMDKKHNPISYIDNHISKPGNKAYDDKVDDNLTYGISALTYSSDDLVVNQAYHEAKIIAEDILRKLEKGVEIFDKKLGTLRKATFNDFAIIIDRESSFDTFKYVFGKYKIPLYAQRKEKLLFTEMSLVIKNLFVLLECVKNNTFDNKFKHAFVSIARSFLVQYEDSFIYKIIKDGSYLFDDIVMKIRKIIEQNPFNNLKETLEQFYETFQFNKHMVELGDINENEYYFDYFISIADTFDKMNRNCLDYINFFNELDKNKLEIETASVKDSDNAVLLINIHKSKGREFPICYFPRLNVKFMVSSDKCPLRIDSKYGMTLAPLYKDNIIPLNNYLAKCQNKKRRFL